MKLTKQDIEKLHKLDFLTIGDVVDMLNCSIYYDKIVVFLHNGESEELVYWCYGCYNSEEDCITECWQDIANGIEKCNLLLMAKKIIEYNKNYIKMDSEELDFLREMIKNE